MLVKRRYDPSPKSIPPQPYNAVWDGWPGVDSVDSLISFRIVANSHGRIKPDSPLKSQRVIGMNEAALGAFEVILSKRVGNAAESQSRGMIKGRSIERDDAVPTALYRHGLS